MKKFEIRDIQEYMFQKSVDSFFSDEDSVQKSIDEESKATDEYSKRMNRVPIDSIAKNKE